VTTVMLVHGAFHGPWCFEEVIPGLEARGVRVVAPELALAGAAEDAADVRDLITGVDDDVLLLGHSYGGMVISRAAVGQDRVRHLVYLCALMTEGSEGLPVGVPTPAMGEAIKIDETGAWVDPAGAVDAFYADCSPATAAAAVARLRPMPASALAADSGTPAAWRTIPSTYVVCSLDHTIHPDDQRAMAQRATEMVEWDASHSPFYSQPDLVVALLSDLATRY